MFRSAFVMLFATLAGALLAPFTLEHLSPESVQVSAAQRVPLRIQLEKGLFVTQPDQQEFIDKVIAKVDSRDLPIAHVYAAYRYAKREKPRFPFYHFQQAMIRLAKKSGVKL